MPITDAAMSQTINLAPRRPPSELHLAGLSPAWYPSVIPGQKCVDMEEMLRRRAQNLSHECSNM